LAFNEIFVAKPWGGRMLARAAGKRLPPTMKVGESWELADRPGRSSVVKGGALAGRTLRELMRSHGCSLLGRKTERGRFPLMVKLLDAADGLSVQVHPDDARAQTMKLADSGKTEAWYVLRSGRGARILAGFKCSKDVSKLRALASSGALAARLRRIAPRRGEAWLCLAGTPHALGPGVVLLEVQQNSDATFRLYDWGRVGLNGRPRALHLEEAVRAVGGGALALRRSRPTKLAGLPFAAWRLLSCRAFVMDRWVVRAPCVRSKGGRFEILHVVEGSGRLREPRWEEVPLKKGATVLVPACVAAYEIAPLRRLEIIRAAEPQRSLSRARE
jgi:mannose-6-phosphate isomerase